MADNATSEQPSVDQALEILRGALAEAVRAEQLRDRLTGLANDEALGEWIQYQIDNGVDFWAAFVEVDHFKRVNDKYGYDDADMLLQRIGGQLQLAAKDFFPSGAIPARAHGDEFFLFGSADTEGFDIKAHETSLDNIRRNIAAIRIIHRDKPDAMQCTVSIGWLASWDVRELSSGLTRQAVRGTLELAVARAKLDRDCVVRFDPSMTRKEIAEGRTDCRECEAKFSIALPIEQRRDDALWCPCCGNRLERPPTLRRVAVAPLSEAMPQHSAE